MNKSKDILIAIPFYNHHNSFIKDILRAGLSEDLIIIDDGSDNKFSDAINGMAEIISHKSNQGKGSAIITASKIAISRNKKILLTIDADGQHSISDLKKIISAVKNSSDDSIILGQRNFHVKNIPVRSRIGNILSKILFRLETGIQISDSQCGLRAYPTRIFNETHCSSKGYDYETEILVKSAWKGIKIKTIDIETIYAESGLSHFKIFKDGTKFAFLHLLLIIQKLLKQIFS